MCKALMPRPPSAVRTSGPHRTRFSATSAAALPNNPKPITGPVLRKRRPGCLLDGDRSYESYDAMVTNLT